MICQVTTTNQREGRKQTLSKRSMEFNQKFEFPSLPACEFVRLFRCLKKGDQIGELLFGHAGLEAFGHEREVAAAERSDVRAENGLGLTVRHFHYEAVTGFGC